MPATRFKYQEGGNLHGACVLHRILFHKLANSPDFISVTPLTFIRIGARSRHGLRRAEQRLFHIQLAEKKKKGFSACPAHCAKKRQPSDSAEEDDGGDGGGASMSGRAGLQQIHLL